MHNVAGIQSNSRASSSSTSSSSHLNSDDVANGGMLRKVLLVDDDLDIAELGAMLLSDHGFEVVVAHSAHEALQVLECDNEVDAMVSDIVMPGMDGIDLADAVTSMYPKMKVVLVSGYSAHDVIRRNEKRYLFAAKPYQISKILELLRN
jgi:two-component system OmpR family response regulator